VWHFLQIFGSRISETADGSEKVRSTNVTDLFYDYSEFDEIGRRAHDKTPLY